MRLTKYEPQENSMFPYQLQEDELRNRLTAIHKLGQLEDVEDELGIDLLTFSKLLYALDKECVYVKVKKTKQYNGYSVDEETGEIERNIIARFSRYANGTREWFFTISFGNISSVNHYLLKDYGKTWALTKEELES